MSSLSIFESLREKIGEELPITPLTKATLVHLSHTLEDFVLTNRLPAFLFTGFQESSHWRKETERYRALSEVAMQVCVFAGKPLPESVPANAVQIELDGDDPLRQEWFLAIFSEEFSVILCGLDRMAPFLNEPERQFDTIWSFEPTVINDVLDALEHILEDYRPAVLPQLRQARDQYPPILPPTSILNRFTIELLRFEDKLQIELSTKAQAVEVSKALYRSLAQHAPVVLILLDADGNNVLTTGSKASDVFPTGIPMNDTPLEVMFVDIPNGEVLSRNVLAHDEYEESITLPQGRTYELRSNHIYRNDVLINIICMIVDVTARIQSERDKIKTAQLEVALQKEAELNELRKHMMITLSHELRTPLATIQSATDLLTRYQGRLTPEKRQERLQSIQDQVEYLVQMIEDIDTVVRSDNQSYLVASSPTNIRAVCEELTARLSDTKSRIIDVAYEGELEEVVIDPRWTRYVLLNLLDNALKYSQEDTPIRLNVSAQDDWLRIVVQDYGIGIPEAELAHITKPFYRATNTNGIAGSGLGLVIIQNIVKAHGGSVEVDSAEGGGTTVVVTLQTGI